MATGAADQATSRSSLVFRRARPDEADHASALVAARRDWLRGRGLDQWHRDPSPAVRQAVAAGQCWLLVDGETPIATATLTSTADPEFWTPEEAREPALYLSKAATAMERRGEGLGKLLLHTAAAYAHSLGIPRLRWDVWKTNAELQQHYRDIGATYLRTVDLPHRYSGALFELVRVEEAARIDAPSEVVAGAAAAEGDQ